MDVIHKGPGDLKVTPNLTDYEMRPATHEFCDFRPFQTVWPCDEHHMCQG